MFISTAYAQTAGGGTSGLLMSYLPIILIFGVFYFLVIRPQNLAAKQHRLLVESLKRGDTVALTSGMLARIEKVEGNTLLLQVNKEDTVLVTKDSVIRLLTSDEEKLLESQLKSGKKK